jgi:hypothetical protein
MTLAIAVPKTERIVMYSIAFGSNGFLNVSELKKSVDKSIINAGITIKI